MDWRRVRGRGQRARLARLHPRQPRQARRRRSTQIDRGLTDKELPLVGISTKELVGKIKSIKQTTDELRGSPLGHDRLHAARRTATNDAGSTSTQLAARHADLLPRDHDGRSRPRSKWTVLESRGRARNDRHCRHRRRRASHGRLEPRRRASRSRSAIRRRIPVAAEPADRDQRLADQGRVHGRGRRTTTPSSRPPRPPRSLQELADSDRATSSASTNVVKLEVLDLPDGDGARRRGGAARRPTTSPPTTSSRTRGDDFHSGDDDQRVVRREPARSTRRDKTHCTITDVAAHDADVRRRLEHGVGRIPADDYEVVGDNTKDLVVRLGVGFCAGGRHGARARTTDQRVAPPISVPLNVNGRLSPTSSRSTPTGDIELDYAARAQPRRRHPDQARRSRTVAGARHERRVARGRASTRPTSGSPPRSVRSAVDLGTDRDTAARGTGVGKLGAQARRLESRRRRPLANNKTQTLGDFVTNVGANFELRR